MLKGPCKDCQDRHPGCHAQCEKYIAYDLCVEHYRNEVAKQNRLDDDLYLTSRHSKKRKRRRGYADKHGDN